MFRPHLATLCVLTLASNVFARAKSGITSTRTTSSGSGGKPTTTTWIIIGVVVGVCLLIAILAFVIQLRRIRRANRALGPKGQKVYDPPSSPPVGGFNPAQSIADTDVEAQGGYPHSPTSYSHVSLTGHPQQHQDVAQMSQVRYPEPAYQPPTIPLPTYTTDHAQRDPERVPTLPPYTAEDNHV